MMRSWLGALCLAFAGGLCLSPSIGNRVRADDATERTVDDSYWVAPMAQVHAKFRGQPGTFAHFGDSITVSAAFWTPLADQPRGLSSDAAARLERVKKYMQPQCWRGWKGAEFGNDGGKTIRWASENIDDWLKRHNPEVALIMFGTNDIGQIDPAEYREKTREVVRRCLDNGTIVILNTLPPRSGKLQECREFAKIVNDIAHEAHVPIVDYFEEVLRRRPDDWDGSNEKFKSVPGDDYQVPTLISRDGVHPSYPTVSAGDFSEQTLDISGYALRSYLVLNAYARVIDNVLQPEPGTKPPR